MVLGAPRSGTAWAANWLSTDRTLCLHDPLFKHHYSDLEHIQTRKRLGIACTGSALFPDWVLHHPAPKLILHRNFDEINCSLDRVGLPGLPPLWYTGVLDQIDGLHVDWQELFHNPEPIWSHLLPDIPFDAERHAMLRELEVQIRYEGVDVNPTAVRRLMRELAAAMRELS